MRSQRKKFKRPLGKRRYKKMFVLAVEGRKTEPQYFAIVEKQNQATLVRCLTKRNQGSPQHILTNMKKYLSKRKPRSPYEAWLVVDKDQWTNEQLSPLYQWSKKADNYGFALSNPAFEFWLLLHFEDGNGVNSKNCLAKLKKYLPNYDKNIDENKISDKICDAINRAKKKDTPPCNDWPRKTGTTVYKLVQNILGP